MRDHHEHFYPVLIIAAAGIMVLACFLVLTPRMTGNIVGVGGNSSALNLVAYNDALSWVGLYGNLTTNTTNATLDMVGGQVLQVNLTYSQAFTNDTVIVASMVPDPLWTNISPASHAAVNTFIGKNPADAVSADNTLQELVNFTIDDIIYESWSVAVNSFSGTYQTGALVSNGSLLFVTKPVNGSGFDNSSVDFQMMLPIPASGVVNYTFFVFEQSEYPGEVVELPCNASINLTASLWTDNQSVILEWADIGGATSYEILYVDGLDNNYLNFSSPTVVNNGLVTSWVDAAPSDERYYRIRLNDSNNSCVGQDIVGTLSLNLSPDYNLVSTPFIKENKTVAETLRSIDGDYSEVLVLDNAGKTYQFYLIVGQNIFKNFDDITTGKGYWIRTNK
ncbi:hypothetical protein GF367_03035, partial [Candidatus Woesearchaeota archaeon]|nr:hypothetical protein [Candidatus Woesearchaeota archaeon]